MKAENQKLAKMLEELSSEHISTDSDRFGSVVKKHGFEHVRTDKNGDFVVRDMQTEKYFLVNSSREYSEIAKP